MAEPRSRSWPRRVWIFHSNGSSSTAALGSFHRLLAHGAVILLQPLGHGRKTVATAGGLPLTYQRCQFGPHTHQPERGFRAVQVMVDLVSNGDLFGKHLRPQGTDFATYFVNSVVHT